MCVASRNTGGATPASNASCQREAHRHQRSPGSEAGEPGSGHGVDRSLPLRLREVEELGSHLRAHDVHAGVSTPVVQQPSR